MPVNSFENYPMSWKPDLKAEKAPLYKALAHLLEQDIKDKVLTPGTKLPPQRELADYLDINLSTVSRAFKLCEQKGLICAAVGSGTFVSSDASVNTLLLTSPEEHQRIEMGAILPNWEANHILAEYTQKMSIELEFPKLFQYGMPNGTAWQRDAAVEWMKKAGFETQIDNILLASGGQNGITATLAALFQPGDRIGTDPVVFPGIKTAAQMLGIQLIPIQQEENEITEEGLEYACKNEKIKGLYLIPDYHNPTTHTMSLEKRKQIAKISANYQLIIMEDAINSLLMEHIIPPVASFATEQTVYISSLSKVISPGLRIAYLSAPHAYKKKIATALYNMNISVPPMLNELAARIIQSGDWEKIANERQQYIKKQNAWVDQILGTSGNVKEGGQYRILGANTCPFRWLLLSEKFTGKTFELYAKDAGVQIYSAERFVVGNALVPRAVRIAVTSTKDTEEFVNGLTILQSILSREEDMTFF